MLRKKEEHERRKEEAWQMIATKTGTLPKSLYGELAFGTQRLCGEEYRSAQAQLTQYPESEGSGIRLEFRKEGVQKMGYIPKGAGWAYVKVTADKIKGPGTWFASLWGEDWKDHSRSPDHGDIVRIHDLQYIEERYKNKPKVDIMALWNTHTPSAWDSIEEESEDIEEMNNWTDEDVFVRQREDEQQIEEEITVTLPELQAGDQMIPLEQIKLRVFRPLPNAAEEISRQNAPPRWKEVRWKAPIRMMCLRGRVPSLLQVLQSRGPQMR
jgi:hypothetical protein